MRVVHLQNNIVTRHAVEGPHAHMLLGAVPPNNARAETTITVYKLLGREELLRNSSTGHACTAES